MRTGLQLLQVSVLARLLTPADFGLMAITGSTLTVLSLLADLGLSRAIIHFDSTETSTLSSLYWLNLIMASTLSLLLALAAPAIEKIFKLQGLEGVLIAVSPFFVISSLGQQFVALAERNLEFPRLATNEILAALTGSATAICFAINGAGVYSLVAGLLATTASASGLAWLRLSSGYRPHFDLKFAQTKPHLRFGAYLIGEGLINALVRQADVFVAGIATSSSSLGIYTVPRDLSLRVGMVVNPIITRIGFPIMARLKGDMASLKTVYVETLRMTMSINFPAYLLLAAFADDVVRLLYGPQWLKAAGFLRILAFWGMARATTSPVGSLLHAVGFVRRALLWNLMMLVSIPAIGWVAIHRWGLPGLAYGLVIVQILLITPAWRYLVHPACGIDMADYLKALLRPLFLAAASVLPASFATSEVDWAPGRLFLGAAVSGLLYLFLSWHFNRQWFDAFRAVLGIRRPSAR